ncbi:hypothetical protein [Estrella lausannensis]|nr:hypothetical protein [Estrella lausannensis]
MGGANCRPAPTAAITSTESQLMIRQAQTREYEQVSKKQAMRASIATLQDLNFILDKVDADLGAISASKFSTGISVKVTVTIREKAPNLVTVRANTTYGERTVDDPVVYQDFFALLDKSLFLVKNQVD